MHTIKRLKSTHVRVVAYTVSMRSYTTHTITSNISSNVCERQKDATHTPKRTKISQYV